MFFWFVKTLVVDLQRQASLTGDSCLLCGPLQVQDKGKTWTKVWAAVTKAEPLVLYLQSSGQVRVAVQARSLVVIKYWYLI